MFLSLLMWLEDAEGMFFVCVSLIYRDQGLRLQLLYLSCQALHSSPPAISIFSLKVGASLLSSKCGPFFSFFSYRIEWFAFVFSAFPSALRFLRAVSTSTPLVFTKCWGSHVVALVTAPHLSFRFVHILRASFFNFFHLKLALDIYSSSSFPSPFSVDADLLTGTKT